jgi:hypothetical protein
MTAEEDPQASAADAIGAGEAATGEAAALPDREPDDLLHELSRAMHAAALSQHQRMVDEVARVRAAQVETIKARSGSEAEQLKATSQADIEEIDAWAKTATKLIAAERVRRIDARRERLQAELSRQDTIAEREVMAVEVSLEDHEAALEAFFARLEGETDPASIAQLASSLPSLPSLSDAAEAARRHAITEFAPIDEAADDAVGDNATVDGAVEVSASRLMAVMDPAASAASGTGATSPWPEPHAIAVPAGAVDITAGTEAGGPGEKLAPVAAGSRTLLRSTPAARPIDRLLGRNREPNDDPDRKD